MERHRTAERLRNGPQFVDAMAMIAVGMSDDHAIELAHVSRKQLLPQIRPAIDQNALILAFDQDG